MSDTPDFPTVPYLPHTPASGAEAGARAFHDVMSLRRSVRHFSARAVPWEVVAWIIRAAGTAPSGAHKQPWRFVAVQDPAVKRKIREAAEVEEREFYERRATKQWLADLAPLGTDWRKDFLEVAPWVIVVFKLMKTDSDEGVYYVNESVGIATGLLLAAAQHAGLATLTHTPSPMGFLGKVLDRPAHERPYLVIPLGYAAEGARVPDLARKPLEEIAVRV
jgi:iodotyrosine deiodinase